jgi:hypothetical protein
LHRIRDLRDDLGGLVTQRVTESTQRPDHGEEHEGGADAAPDVSLLNPCDNLCAQVRQHRREHDRDEKRTRRAQEYQRCENRQQDDGIRMSSVTRVCLSRLNADIRT